MTDAINHGNVVSKRLGRANVMVRLLLYAFVVACVFDPADQVLGVKVWLFAVACAATCLAVLPASDEIPLPVGLLVYVLVFITIPLLSILWYFLSNGTQPYAGFALIKSYFLVSLAIVLVVNRIDMVPFLSATLTLLALLTITISIAVRSDPELFSFLHEVGERFGVWILANREYGEGLSVTQITFVTSPMLAISIPHYFDRAISCRAANLKWAYLVLTAISIIGMLLAGLRNTMAVALLLPLLVWPLYTRRIVRNFLISLGTLAVLSILFVGKLKTLLNPAELSNNVKLTFLGDYVSIFSDPVTLIAGQGLGAYYRWSSSGQPNFETTGANFYFITELTYAEMIRSFGLIGGVIMLLLLLYPVVHAFFANTDRRQRALAVGFLAYLGMSATNPLLFSSSGMLLLSALLGLTFLVPDVRSGSSVRSPS
jgi:hypothetical protein